MPEQRRPTFVSTGQRHIERRLRRGIYRDSPHPLTPIDVGSGVLLPVQNISRFGQRKIDNRAVAVFGDNFNRLRHVRRIAPRVQLTSFRIVRATANLAHDPGIELPAEGVSNAEQRALLLSTGCEFAPGDLFGVPVAAERVAALLEHGRRPTVVNVGTCALREFLGAALRQGRPACTELTTPSFPPNMLVEQRIGHAGNATRAGPS